MIINGGSRSNASFFAKHLVNADHNELVTLCEVRNLGAQSVAEAFREMAAVAMGTLCKNFFYHANLNPRLVESLTEQQWSRAVDLLEQSLHLDGHARFVVEHRKKGRTHRHVIWLRIDVKRMVAVEMTDDYEKHQAAARQLEREFGLQPETSVLSPGREKGKRPDRRPKPWETFRGQATGIDPQAVAELVTLLFKQSENGALFATALKEQGYQLVQSDRRALCIVDGAGHVHSLARRLTGIRAAEIQALASTIPEAMMMTLAYWRENRLKAPAQS